MKFSKNLNKEQKTKYISICEIIWGCIPVDVDWATQTKLYKEMEELEDVEINDIVEKNVKLFKKLLSEEIEKQTHASIYCQCKPCGSYNSVGVCVNCKKEYKP